MSALTAVNWSVAVRARAEIDEQLNRAMALMAPHPDQGTIVPNQPVAEYLAARINAARAALDRFERALKGGGQ